MRNFPKLIELIDHKQGIYEEVNVRRLKCNGIYKGANDYIIFSDVVGSVGKKKAGINQVFS